MTPSQLLTPAALAELKPTLGELLRTWRNARRMGIREAAKIIGISPATLGRIENNKSMDARIMLKLVNQLFGASR